MKIVKYDDDEYYIVNYPKRNCEGEGTATIRYLSCEVIDGSEKIFAILVIILIAFL
jgi:hypothetical protein